MFIFCFPWSQGVPQAQLLYQNKNITPFTETQNQSNEENILLFHY